MSAPGPIKQAWLRWKTLRLPWRKRLLVGLDLEGNTFWEFKDLLSSKQGRMRRIVEYPRNTHYSDVQAKITPAWHQWLRHTRDTPPSLTEQSQDLVRQRNLKILAAQADARWAAKPTYLDAPDKSQPVPAIGVRDPGGYSKSELATNLQQNQGAASIQDVSLDNTVTKKAVENITGGERIQEEGIPTQQLDNRRRNLGKEGARLDEEERKAAVMAEEKKKDNPWKNARGGPSESWQPEAWTPGRPPARR